MMDSMTYSACILLFLWSTLFYFEGVLSWEGCYNGYHLTTYYCEYGCCGDGLDKHCCAYSLVALIAGCVVGALIIIAFLVVVGCYYMKRKNQAGRVIAPGTTTVAVVNGAVLPNNSAQSAATANQTKVTSVQYTGQTYPGPTYGQGYPPNGQGPAYGNPPPYGQGYPPNGQGPVYGYPPPYGQTYPPPATSQQTNTQTSGQAQYPPGPPPEASMYQ